MNWELAIQLYDAYFQNGVHNTIYSLGSYRQLQKLIRQ